MKDTERSAVPERTSSGVLDDVACPFCGLLCDDLKITVKSNVPTPIAAACALSREGFGNASQVGVASPRLRGSQATLAGVLETTASLIAAAKHPVFVAQGTDVAAARALLALADLSGAVVDHSHSAGLMRNLAVLQDGGWMTATLSEARNRTDFFLIAGERLFALFPRFVERIVQPAHTLFAAQRRIVLLGPWDKAKLPPEIKAPDVRIIATPIASLGEIAAALRALLRGRAIQSDIIGEVPKATLSALIEEMRAAHYCTLAWSASEFDFPHADLAIQQLVECVRELNLNTRASALPLGGNRADMSLNQVCTWQSAYPLRTDFQRGYPRFDPWRNDYLRLLDEGEADFLLWVSALDPHATPPANNVPTIVLGHPAMEDTGRAAAFIPVGVPGIDHPGHFFRSDNVVAVPLRGLRPSRYANAAQVLSGIEDRLRARMISGAAGA